MSDLTARWVQAKKREPEERPLGGEEQRALAKLQKLARKAGATLASEGKGGLNPSLVLETMKRDEFRCKRCGGWSNLSVHHKGHLENPNSAKLERMGKSNDPENIVTVCEDCHDGIHDEDRERGE